MITYNDNQVSTMVDYINDCDLNGTCDDRAGDCWGSFCGYRVRIGRRVLLIDGDGSKTLHTFPEESAAVDYMECLDKADRLAIESDPIDVQLFVVADWTHYAFRTLMENLTIHSFHMWKEQGRPFGPIG